MNRTYGGVRGRKIKKEENFFIFLLLDCKTPFKIPEFKKDRFKTKIVFLPNVQLQKEVYRQSFTFVRYNKIFRE